MGVGRRSGIWEKWDLGGVGGVGRGELANRQMSSCNQEKGGGVGRRDGLVYITQTFNIDVTYFA